MTDFEERVAFVERWSDRNIRFRELLQITGFTRGYVQGIEQRGLWKYAGPERGTGNWRAYGLKDVLAFELGWLLSGAGFEVATAWAIVRGNLDDIMRSVIVDREREFTVMRNTVKIVIPAAAVIKKILEDVEGFYAKLDRSDSALLANKAANDDFDRHDEK